MATSWLSRNDFRPDETLHSDYLNNLANDDRYWTGDVNGGGHKLSNVILSGSGGFEFLPSPVEVTPGSDQASRIQWDQTVGGVQQARWSSGKDAAAETGANTGSNFAIARYDDSGALLGTPITIRRSDGLITLGAQKWTGPVDAGGQTISNLVIAGYVPTSRQILTGTGLAGGGDLSADRTLTVVNDTTTQRHRISNSGALIATRQELNFIQGANVTITAADDTPNNRVNLTIASTGGGGSGLTDPTINKGDLIVRGAAAVTRLGVGTDGQVLVADAAQPVGMRWGSGGASGSQTPWLSDIDGGGFNLGGAGRIAVGNAGTVLPSAGPTSPRVIIGSIASGSPTAELDLINNSAASGIILGSIGFGNYNLAVTEKRVAAINGSTFGTPDGGSMDFYCWSAGVAKLAIRVQPGAIGMGIPAPLYDLHLSSANPYTQMMIESTVGTGDTGLIIKDSARSYKLGINTGAIGGGRFGINDMTAGGLARLVVDPSGNVGIGTTAPSALLDVYSTSGLVAQFATPANPLIYITERTQSVLFGLAVASGAGSYITGTAAKDGVLFNANGGIVLGTNGTARLSVTNAGNVGVGNTATVFPDGSGSDLRLLVGSAAASGPLAHLDLIGNVGAGSYLGVISASNYALAGAEKRVAAIDFRAGSVTNSGVMEFYTWNAGAVGIRMTITEIGSIGIGTANPVTMFDLATNGPQAMVSMYAAGTAGARRGRIVYDGGGAIVGGGFVFQGTDDAGTFNANMLTIRKDGRVGIGNTAPGYALDVAGDVNCSGVFRVNGVPIGAGGSAAFTTQNSSTGKSIGATYQNTTGKALLVAIVISAAQNATLTVWSDAGGSPGTYVASATNFSTVGYSVISVIFCVAPGYYFKSAVTGSYNPSSWTEWN
jgi:hypothetical protein